MMHHQGDPFRSLGQWQKIWQTAIIGTLKQKANLVCLPNTTQWKLFKKKHTMDIEPRPLNHRKVWLTYPPKNWWMTKHKRWQMRAFTILTTACSGSALITALWLSFCRAGPSIPQRRWDNTVWYESMGESNTSTKQSSVSKRVHKPEHNKGPHRLHWTLYRGAGAVGDALHAIYTCPFEASI